MSGIYIPGVTAPEDNTILLRIYPESDGIYYTEQLDIDEDILDKYFAIPVPEHGRLIDGDALRQAMYHEAFELDSPMQKWDSGCWIRYKMFERMEESAPTIIPADKEGEG